MKRKERILAELQEDSEEDRKNKLDMLKSELESVNTRINGDVARFKGTNVLTQKQIFTARKRCCGKVVFSEVFVCPQGVSVQGGSLSRGISVTETLRPVRWKSGRYASYWDTFLFSLISDVAECEH